MKKKAIPGATRVKGTHDRKIAAGLRLIKIYVVDEREKPDIPGYITEAERVKRYAAKQPLTKLIRDNS